MMALPFSEPHASQFIALSKTRHIKAGEYFIRKGDIPRKFAFVQSGLFRYLYIDQNGEEYTKNIISEGQFISSYSAMILNSPSHFYIEALEDAEILEIHQEQWEKLKQNDPFWNQLLVTMLEKAFIVKEKRERDLLLLDAETRYLNFLEEFPNSEQRIKLKIVASYLGIKPESLSRIRAKVREKLD